MKSYLEEKIEEYHEKDNEIRLLYEEIEHIQQREKEQVQLVKDSIKEKYKEMPDLGTTIDIRFWDLVEELSELTGISPDDMLADVYGVDYGKKTDTLEDFARKKPAQRFQTIISNKDDSYASRKNHEEGDFYYRISFKCNLNEIQADGRRLIDHCYIKKAHDDGLPHKPIISYLWTNPKDTKDIICHFTLQDIAKTNESDDYYPTGLLTQAIINIENKKRNQSLEKIRKMVI